MPLRALLTFFLLTLLSPVWAQTEKSVIIKKVVIDPGHGGGDPGTVSKCGKVKEKEITLSVALKLGELIKRSFPEIEIIYTRSKDISVPLDRRSEIANRAKADLFISIHVNSVASQAPSGSETFVMGTDRSGANWEVTMLENSVILLEGDDYAERYEGFKPNDPESYIIFSLLQNAHLEQSLTIASLIQEQMGRGPIKKDRGIKQAPFLVLWKTSMPSVLVELGFISNPADLKVLREPANHHKFAKMIFDAFTQYKLKYERSFITPLTTKEVESEVIERRESETHFRVQIASLGRVVPPTDKTFQGVPNLSYIKVGNLYKYSVGPFATIKEANQERKKLSNRFPGAFVIKVVNGKIVTP